MVLLIKFKNSNKIKPIPNSIAENTKKKNVKDIKLILSKKKPIIRVKAYNDIHINSAVSNKCKFVLVFIIILKNKI